MLASALVVGAPAAAMELSTVSDGNYQSLLQVTLPTAGWGVEGRVVRLAGGYAAVAGTGVYPLRPDAARPSRDFASVIPVGGDGFVAVDRFETSYTWPYPMGRLVAGRFGVDGFGAPRVLALPERERVSLIAAAEDDGVRWVAYTSQQRKGHVRLAAFPSGDGAATVADVAVVAESPDAFSLSVGDQEARLLMASRDAKAGCRVRLRLERFDARSLASRGVLSACVEGRSTLAQAVRIHASRDSAGPFWFVMAMDGGRLDVWTVRAQPGGLVVTPAASVEGAHWMGARGVVDDRGGLAVVTRRGAAGSPAPLLRVSADGKVSNGELHTTCPGAPETGGSTGVMVGVDGEGLIATSRATPGGLCMNVWKL